MIVSIPAEEFLYACRIIILCFYYYYYFLFFPSFFLSFFSCSASTIYPVSFLYVRRLPFISLYLPRKISGSSHTLRKQNTCEKNRVPSHALAFSRRDPEASQDTNAKGCVTLESQPAVRSTLCRPYLANATPSSLSFLH